MGILQTVHRQHIPFDPSSETHRAAYWKLRSTGKQDEQLRFIVEEGYGSVLSMMRVKLADWVSEPSSADVVDLPKRRKASGKLV